MQVRIGPSGSARNVVTCVGSSIKYTTTNVYQLCLLCQELMAPSILGFLRLGSLSKSSNNFAPHCSMLVQKPFQHIPDTVLPVLRPAAPQSTFPLHYVILLCVSWKANFLGSVIVTIVVGILCTHRLVLFSLLYQSLEFCL